MSEVTNRKPKRTFENLTEIFDHNTKESCWLLIDQKVYDVTDFKHPGGKQILLSSTGQDATSAFDDIGHSKKAYKILEELHIGDYVNPEEEAEVKVHDSDDGVSLFAKLILVALFIASTYGLFLYIDQQAESNK